MARDARPLVLAGLMGGLFLAAMDATVLSVAMPSVVADLGGSHLYAWGFTAYMLTTAVSMPLLGALSDRHGHRRFFLLTLGIFVVGSAACGAAPTMPTFLASRALQGIGAGGMLSIPFALAATLYEGSARGRALGRLAGVWGVAAVIGPLLGAAAISILSWRWIFFVNIPVGILGAILVSRHHQDEARTHAPRVDATGALLLVVGLGALLVALQGATPGRGLLAAAGALSLVGFAWRERRAPHPLLPMDLLKRRAVLLPNLAATLAAFAIFAPIAFMPRYVQAAYGADAVLAAVFPLSIGWSAASIVTGSRAHGRARAFGFAGLGLLSAALLASPFVLPFGLVAIGALGLLYGIGMGVATPALLLSVQNAAPRAQLGAATSAQAFLRNAGGAVGVVILGALIPAGRHGELPGLLAALVPAGLIAAAGALAAAGSMDATRDAEGPHRKA